MKKKLLILILPVVIYLTLKMYKASLIGSLEKKKEELAHYENKVLEAGLTRDEVLQLENKIKDIEKSFIEINDKLSKLDKV